MSTTFEEAKVCPKCGIPGQDRKTVKVDSRSTGLPVGTTVHIIYCVTKLCPWYDTPWNVQVNPDGSIPPPKNHTGTHDKVYAGFEGHDRDAQAFVEYLRREQEAQTAGRTGEDGHAHEVRGF